MSVDKTQFEIEGDGFLRPEKVNMKVPFFEHMAEGMRVRR